jgi:uncharacterized protein YbjT (DUF2867 family)
LIQATGATGYVGSTVVRRLLSHGLQVAAMVRDASAAPHARACGYIRKHQPHPEERRLRRVSKDRDYAWTRLSFETRARARSSSDNGEAVTQG